MFKRYKQIVFIVLLISLVLFGILRKCFDVGKIYTDLPFDTTATHEKRFHYTRYEGLPKNRAVLEIFRYIKKYKHKRPYANQDIKQYFQCQKSIIKSHSNQVNPKSKNISLALFGDLMWVGKVSSNYVSGSIMNYLCNHDLVFGNLESPIDKNRRVPNILPDYLTYNSNPTLLDAFTDHETEGSPFTVLSLANNHVLDRGVEGVLNTMKLLDEMGIMHTGVFPKMYQGKKYLTLEKNGIKIGFYAATYGLNFDKPEYLSKIDVNHLRGIAPPDSLAIDQSEVQDVIASMKAEKVDFIIISMHWGYEFELYPDPLIQKVAHSIVQAGADLILGSHPHIFQPIEVVYVNGYAQTDEPETKHLCPKNLNDEWGGPRKAVIFYSLGNFVSRMYTPSCQVGVISSITLHKNTETLVTDWYLNNSQFVYNVVPTFPGKKHRLMFYNEFRDLYLVKPTKRNRKIKEEVEFMIRHFGA
jgi:poly-gamma-glutamate synthesis protein (capsule biosynthesis protein)